MVIVKDKRDYLIKTKVLVGQFFGQQPDDGFIELVEMDTLDSSRMTKVSKAVKESGDNSDLMALFRELLPKVIVEHSLYKSDTEKYSSDEVAGIIFSKVDLSIHVIEQYSRDVLFTLGKKSDSN